MKHLYHYEGRHENDGPVWIGGPHDDPNSRGFCPGDYYMLAPDDPIFKRYPEMVFEPVDGPPSCDNIGSIPELIENGNTLHNWIIGPVAQKLGWWRPVAGALFTSCQPQARELALPELKKLESAAAGLKYVGSLSSDQPNETEALLVLNSILQWAAGAVGAPKQNRTGRPRKGETDKDTLVISALARHHRYESGGSIGNYEPAGVRELHDANPGLSTASISRFLKSKFGDYRCYKAACAVKRIGLELAKWQGETPKRFADLRPEEYGRREED